MSDDWSLKEYATDEIKIGHTDGSYAIIKFPDNHYVYTNKAIELLRQKLIEDFEEINDWLIKRDDSVDLDKIKEIINKRFGEE